MGEITPMDEPFVLQLHCSVGWANIQTNLTMSCIKIPEPLGATRGLSTSSVTVNFENCRSCPRICCHKLHVQH